MFTKALVLTGLLAAAQGNSRPPFPQPSPTSLSPLTQPPLALTITAPTLDTKWDLSQTNTIEWKAVDTDPRNFTILLVDQSSSSGQKSTEIAKMVNTADNKYSFTNFAAAPGKSYQIRFRGTEVANQGDLAQSQNFEVTKSGVGSTATQAPSGTQTGAAAAASSDPAKGNGAVGNGVRGMVGVAGVVVAVGFMLM